MREGSGIFRSINSLMMDMYDEGGMLTEYSTQINQTSKSIMLLVQRVTKDEKTIGELSLYIENNLSWLSATADNIIFNFTKAFQIKANGSTVFDLDTNGNLKITGSLQANSTIGSLTVDTSGSIKGSGSLVTNGVVSGYKTQTITVSATNNSVQTIEVAKGLFVFLTGNVTSNTHFFQLPTFAELKSTLNISESIYFSARLIIINQSKAGKCFLSYRDGYGATTNQPWKMTFDDTHRTGGDAVTQLATGDYIEVLLIYNPDVSEYRAYEIVHNN